LRLNGLRRRAGPQLLHTRSNSPARELRQVRHFVEEQRAAIRVFDRDRHESLTAPVNAPARMARTTRLEQVVRQRRAVHIAEPAIAPCTQLMDRSSHQFLANTALPSIRTEKLALPRAARRPRRTSVHDGAHAHEFGNGGGGLGHLTGGVLSGLETRAATAHSQVHHRR
jgi:hypothetical protein